MLKLLPDDRDHGWAPFAWLVFMVFFFVQPIVEHPTWRSLSLTTAEALVFLVLYFWIFWVRRPYNYVILATMAVMGLGLANSNQGSSVFIIFTAAFIPWVMGRAKRAVIALLILFALIGIHAAVFHPPAGFWITSTVVTLGVGFSNIHFAEKNRVDAKLRMAHDEIEHLAKVAERERIARDLHDVLGHTLSLIIVKSTLAGKLIDSYPQRAKSEISDIEKVSREAIAEIRSTLRGYNTYKLCDEIERAKSTMHSAGVNVREEMSKVDMTPAQEQVVALIMREAVTNVVRHAQARNCFLRVAPNNGNCVFEIQDDGRGGIQVEGNGLRGMRERIEALGGTVVRDTSVGTRLKFEFPLNASDGKH